MFKHGIRICFFTLSLFFLGAHSLLPHNHDQSSTHDHTALPAWVDFLADLVNSTDLGEEHLEDYRTQETVLNLAVPFAYELTPLQEWPIAWVLAHEEPLRPDTEAHIHVQHHWLSTPTFRGPPVA